MRKMTSQIPIISLKFEMYAKIMHAVHEMSPSIDVVKQLITLFPSISPRTLGSICAQEYQRKTKKNHYRHNSAESVEYYYKRYLQAVEKKEKPGILLRLALEVDISPSLLSRNILERHLTKNNPAEIPNRQQITRMLKDTSLIPDGMLAVEIYLCVLNDDNYGPLADIVKHSIGHEYECKLSKILKDNNISFLEESQMRALGYDKTPDFKLEIPFAVNGFIVNWVESKASFGDEENHQSYLKEQFWSYWNRFGSGLVIYWFGYVEELDVHRHKGIMLQPNFPSDITIMDPSSISTSILYPSELPKEI